ncbi:MAG: nitroreductase family protein [Candidatus Bathyarchaeia archaeon]
MRVWSLDALEAIRRRRSVRRFKPDPIPKETIEKLVDAGRWAPSGMNVQPWEFIAVTNPETRRRIAGITDYGKFIAQAPLCIAVFCKDTKYYLEDGCAAVENILIAATALGLGSCWVAGDKKRYVDQVREMLNVPRGYKLVALIAIGYPLDGPSERRRRDLKEILHYESF